MARHIHEWAGEVCTWRRRWGRTPDGARCHRLRCKHLKVSEYGGIKTWCKQARSEGRNYCKRHRADGR